jgi:hypothetical protein
MRKILLLYLLILANSVLESCCNIEDECFDLDIAEIKNFSLYGNSELETLDTIKANKYGILIESKTIDRTCSLNFSIGGGLNAINCDEPLYFMKDEVTDISIKSNSDLSLNYTAGSELKDLFTPIELNADCLGENDTSYQCLRDYSIFEGINSIEDAFNDIMATNFYIEEKDKIDVELLNIFSMQIEETIIENRHQMTIKFDFESGNTVELKTDEIIIN